MKKLTVTICGGGNGAHACAALLALKGHKVNIYTPLQDEVERFLSNNPTLEMDLEVNNQKYENLKLNKVSFNAEEVIPEATIVFVIVPAFAHDNIVENIRKHLSKNTLLVVIPNRGGFEYQAKIKLAATNIVGLQTLPWACRTREFGKSVEVLGTKKSVQSASIPNEISDVYIKQLEELLDIELIMVKNMVTLTLSNVGQIIHPGIMYGLFKNNPYVTYSKDDIPLFYQGVTEDVGRILNNLSDEIVGLATELSRESLVDIDEVPSLHQWLLNSYSHTIQDFTSLDKMFSSNLSYQGLRVPSKEIEAGVYTPDFNYRYVSEDVPYGLLIIKSLAEMLNLETPQIDEVINSLGEWNGDNYMQKLGIIKEFSRHSRLPEFYSFNNIGSIFEI